MKNFFETIKTSAQETVRATAKLATFVLLANLPVFSQNSLEKDQGFEDLKQLAKEGQNKIALNIKEKGQSGYIGEQKSARWVSPDGSEVVIGYNEAGKEQWMLVGDETNLFLDRGMDGTADRYILNKTNQHKRIKKAFNSLNAFINIDDLSKEASIAYDLAPEPLSIFEIGSDETGAKMKSVDFESGGTEEASREDAVRYRQGLQKMFANEVNRHANLMSK